MAAILLVVGCFRPTEDASAAENNSTPLHDAAWDGRARVARELLAADADVNAVDSKGWTPLHLAAIRGNPGIARMLIDTGADVDAVDLSLGTPLHSAVGGGHTTDNDDHIAVAALLIEEGANIHAINDFGQTPLHTAVTSGKPAIVAFLLENGVDTTIEDNDGQTARQRADYYDYAASRAIRKLLDNHIEGR